MSGAGGVLLVAADEQAVALVPGGEGPEEGLLREFGAGEVVVAAGTQDAGVRGAAALVVVQHVQVGGQVVAAPPQERVREVGGPGGQGREFVLERADHDRAQPLAQASFEGAVHRVQEHGARVRAEVVESLRGVVMDRQEPAAGAVGGPHDHPVAGCGAGAEDGQSDRRAHGPVLLVDGSRGSRERFSPWREAQLSPAVDHGPRAGEAAAA